LPLPATAALTPYRACRRPRRRHMRQVWILYASYLSNADELFRYLYKNEIGTARALFWVSWAWVAESSLDYIMADKVSDCGR
jgi:Mad3/BUB1 homology region 1